MTEISAFDAKCASCGRQFSHPSVGDFSYGVAVLCTVDGSHFATVDGFGEFAQRVEALGVGHSLWAALAALADPVAGKRFTHSLRCPHCTSPHLEYWEGSKTGIMDVPEASFLGSSALSDEQIVARIVASQGRTEA